MREAVGERGVENHLGPVLDVEHTVYHFVPGGRLHPRVERQDPERAHGGAEGDEEGREGMDALAHAPVTEEHDAEEARSMNPGQLVPNWKLIVTPLTTPSAKVRANTLVQKR
jgi:hypothetical protein